MNYGWRKTSEDFLLALVPDTSGCLVWPGVKSHNGYGLTMFEGKRLRTHRLAYILTYGPIPAKQVVMHTCDNRACCNPAHLRAGSQQENVLDSVQKGRKPRGNTHANTKISDEQIAEMCSLRDINTAELAVRYKISRSHVQRILKGYRRQR